MIEEDLRIKLAKLENKQNGLYNKIYSLNEQINSIREAVQQDPSLIDRVVMGGEQ